MTNPVAVVKREPTGSNESRSGSKPNIGFSRRGTIIGLVLAAIAIVYLAPRLGIASSDYGLSKLFAGADTKVALSTHTVAKMDLVVSVTEDGNLESSSNIDVKCQVAGGSSILSIVKDGTVVQKGDKLVELDTAALDEQINTQKITYEKARASSIQAEKDFEVAKIAVNEYTEGTYRKDLQLADSNITIALENLRSAQNALEHSQRMFRKGYVSTLELESQQFSVQRAQLELDAAKTTKEVLERYAKVRTLEDLNSKVATAEAKMKSEAAAFALEESKLKRLEEQLKNCHIVAPADGMVVYANETGSRFGGSQSVTVEEGANVRERQTILRLPDLSKMQVKVNVHESKVDQLRPGMRARIRILDRELQGVVGSIGNQPEPQSWMSGSVKEYATIVKIDGQPEGLKPGMTAEVEILVAHLKDVIALPVAAIVEKGNGFQCWVDKQPAPTARKLLVGLTNDQHIEVKDGVAVGDRVILNPRAVVEEANKDEKSEDKVDVDQKFGKAKEGDLKSKADEKGKGGPGSSDSPGKGGEGGAGGGKKGGSMNWMTLDKDGDKKISKDEAAESPLTNFFDRVDANADGFIDAAEMAAMRARAQKKSGGGPDGAGGGGPGGGPSGGPSGGGP